MNEQKIRANIRKLLFEDNWVAYATDDRSAGKFAVADDNLNVPIDPEAQMAVQLSVSEPPVEDEDFKPVNATELAKSLNVLFRDTPEDQIEYVYKQAHRLHAFAEEKSNIKRKKIRKPISNFSTNIKKGSELVKYQPKYNFTFGKFLSYIIVSIITFVAIIIVLDTFKDPLSGIFPNLELLLYNLFETLRDLILFAKDLN